MSKEQALPTEAVWEFEVEGVLQVAAEELGQALAAERTAVQLALGAQKGDGQNGRPGANQR